MRLIISLASGLPGTMARFPDWAGRRASSRLIKLRLPCCLTPPWQGRQLLFRIGLIRVLKSMRSTRQKGSEAATATAITSLSVHFPEKTFITVAKMKLKSGY
jgi:hypothetical protein